MGSVVPKTLLEAVEAICNVDVDAVDPRVSSALPFKPHNQTSNQVICANTMLLPEYRNILETKVEQYGKNNWEEVFNRVMVQQCADNIANISGRVLVQVSPRRVYDAAMVLEQAYAFDHAFNDLGIARDRYAIKIPTTGPAMIAAKELNKAGIRVLGTSIFSLPQAIAASQAGCLYISPYFNEVAAYSDDSLMHKGLDPALEHHMAPMIIHILEAYTQLYKETGTEQPLIIMASNANIGEVVATAELGCQHITVLAHHIKEMAATSLDEATLERYPFLKSPSPKRQAPHYKELQTPERLQGHSKIHALAEPGCNSDVLDIHKNYLIDSGKALDVYIESDVAVSKKIKDVLGVFVNDGDEVARKAIEAEIAKQTGAG